MQQRLFCTGIVCCLFFLAGHAQNTSLAPAASPVVRDSAANKVAQITNTAPVFRYLDPRAPVVGIANARQRYPVVYAGTSWIQIKFQDTIGWIERRNVSIVDPSLVGSPTVFAATSFFFAGIIAVLTALIILIVLFIIRKIKIQKASLLAEKELLIIACDEKHVTYSLTGKVTTLHSCFAELGFRIHQAHGLVTAKKLVITHLPDVVFVDWKLAKNIQPAIESLMLTRTSLSNSIVVFYNVPPGAPRISTVLPNVNYLNENFTDRDIFAFITPLIMTGQRSRAILKSVQANSLEGEISPLSLLEVLQFIEIGKKTGKLSVKSPQSTGAIFCENGRIIAAHLNSAIGKSAIFAILSLRKGQFALKLDKRPVQSNCDFLISQILLEWTKTIDETPGH